MVYEHWRIEDLPWDQLAPAKVDDDLLKVIKAAALVEYNAESYAEYLGRVFEGDEELAKVLPVWASEEVQHGRALGMWAEKIDPDWSLETAMARFRAGYKIEHFANDNSVRGSRTGEMIARCMVETGTSSYYSAIGAATDEPVLKEICAKIAGDEFRHYKIFYETLRRYLKQDNIGRAKRLKIALGRIAETEDDELSYAFFAANAAEEDRYERKIWNREYMRRAYSYYQKPQLDRAVSMIFKACGFDPKGVGGKLASKAAWWMIQKNLKKAEETGREPLTQRAA